MISELPAFLKTPEVRSAYSFKHLCMQETASAWRGMVKWLQLIIFSSPQAGIRAVVRHGYCFRGYLPTCHPLGFKDPS